MRDGKRSGHEKRTWRGALREHRRSAVVILAVWIYLFVHLFYFFRFEGIRYITLFIFLGAAISMGLTLLVFWLLYVRKKEPASLFVPLYLVMALVFLLFLPVGQGPDEQSHLRSVYALSNSILGIENTEDGELIMRKADKEFQILAGDVHPGDFQAYWERTVQSLSDRDAQLVRTDQKVSAQNPYSFLPQALGLTLGRLLGLPAFVAFLMGRGANLLFFLIMAALSIRLLPSGKMILFVLALTPMSLQQTATLSYDAVLSGTAFFIISMTAHLLDGEKKHKGLKLVILLLFCLLILPLKGFAYAPLGFLPVLLLIRRRSHALATSPDEHKLSPRRVGAISAVVAVFVLVVSVAVIPRFGGVAMSEQAGAEAAIPDVDISQGEVYGGKLSYTDEPGYTLEYFAHFPDETLPVYFNTVHTYGDWYLETMIGDRLGWLSIHVSRLLVYGYVLLLFLAAMYQNGEEKLLSRTESVVANALALFSVLFVFGGMLLAWSPIRLRIISGVQGRYFIPLVLIPLLTLRPQRLHKEDSVNASLVLVITLMFFFVIKYLLLGLNPV